MALASQRISEFYFWIKNKKKVPMSLMRRRWAATKTP
eukprot:COSAG04_NODE_104_length_26097_cov_12.466074_24_plen_37_part_00